MKIVIPKNHTNDKIYYKRSNELNIEIIHKEILHINEIAAPEDSHTPLTH